MKDGAPNLRYALQRLRHLIKPPVTITEPPDMIIERDVAVTVRDGTVLRVNVFRPRGEARHAVIMCAHPYGKDHLPVRLGPGRYKLSFQYRIMHNSVPFSHSSLTSWESPDPAFWVARGYVVVNCDLRGFGHSDGVGTLLDEAEGNDYHDLIEWAAAQPWSTGRVGLNGVSYLAISQWRAASTRPPHLAAICPWEGFSDIYRDLACPGGIKERGFFMIWSRVVPHNGRTTTDLGTAQKMRPNFDEYWAGKVPPLPEIDVPALVCASFSDHCLHTRGSFRGFAGISSEKRWLYTHRSPKWAAYYSQEALEFQARFFDWALKGVDNGMASVPPVRVEVRASRDVVRSVRFEARWPLPATRWTRLWLRSNQTLAETPAVDAAARSFNSRSGRLTFSWTAPRDLELTGPMKLRLYVEARGAADVHLFAGVRKFREGREVVFEGSYGFGLDMVTHGWLKASHRALDVEASTEWLPVHTHREPQRLQPGQVVGVDIALLPSATFFARGDVLRLDVQGHWFYLWNPLLGAFPSRYEPSPPGTCVVHLGGPYDAHLLVPLIEV